MISLGAAIVNDRFLIVCLVCIVAVGCFSRLQAATEFPNPRNISVPYADAFARDRKPDSGFSTPKQATSEFMRTLFAAKHDLLRDSAFKRRFLSARLRQRIELALKQYEKWPTPADPADEHPAMPDRSNETLF